VHDDESGEDAQGQCDDGDEGTAQVEKEQQADERDDQEFLQQLLAKVPHRALDQAGAIVGLHDLHAAWEARLQGFHLRLHRADGLERVLAVAHDHHAAGHLALPVQLRDAAAHLRTHLDARHVSQHHRCAALGSAQRNSGEVLERLEVPARSHHVFGLAELQHRAAGLLVGVLNRLDDAAVGDAVGAQPLRLKHDLVLADHAADCRHFGDVRDRLQLVAKEPVLQGPQLAEVILAATVDKRVLVDPAHAGGVRPECGLGAGRQARLHLVQILQHPRAGPVGVSAVLEQDVDEGVAEHRVPAHRLCPRHRHHRGGERVSDLVFDDARGLAGERRADDDLRIGEIRDRV
jgi:hypothetical protein